MEKLGIPLEKVNPNGAIALGHPLGCTGARHGDPAQRAPAAKEEVRLGRPVPQKCSALSPSY